MRFLVHPKEFAEPRGTGCSDLFFYRPIKSMQNKKSSTPQGAALGAVKQSKSEPYFTTVCNGKISEQHLILFVNQMPTDLWFSP